MTILIPHSFQVPNLYTDRAMCLLTPGEWMVLTYAIRRTLGFGKERDRIAISQFTRGVTSRDGQSLDGGTGLSKGTVTRALGALRRFGLLVQIENNDPATNEGTLYELQLDPERIDWTGLEARLEARQARDRDKIAAARTAPHRRRTPRPCLVAPPPPPQPAAPSAQTTPASCSTLPPRSTGCAPSRSTGRTPSGSTGRTPSCPTGTQNPVETQRNPGGNTVNARADNPAHAGSPPPPAPFKKLDLAQALAEVCQMDLPLNQARLMAEAQRLMASPPAGSVGERPTPDLIRQHYGQRGWWWTHDWRGQRGELPNPLFIRETWGRWNLPDPPRAAPAQGKLPPAMQALINRRKRREQNGNQ